MRYPFSWLAFSTLLLAFVLTPDRPALVAQGVETFALSGQVTSAEEGPMEGVLVSAKKAGGTITMTVVSDAQGRYRFPRGRLEAGSYALGIRAIGYDLAGAATAAVDPHQPATADLKLQKAKNVAAQLTNAEWLASFPGTDAQKAEVRGCAHCHSLELITRSKHNAEEFVAVVERMSGYPPLAFPLMPQRTPSPRIGGGEVPRERLLESRRRLAEYLSTLNLSAGPQWSYAFKTLPRPRGDATRVIYTAYDLPRRTRQPHDVVVDSGGMAWYASFGEQILGKLDPKTGKTTEYEIPMLKPSAPTGILGMRLDRDENPWLAMQFQGGIAKFDRKTERFQTWSLPPEMNGPHVQVNQVSPERSYVDGKVWLQDAGTYNVMRLDIASGKFDLFEPYAVPRPNLYDVIPDSMNNGYFTVMGAEEVGRIDAKTGKIAIFKTPTKGSGPRRGMMDAQDRLWFGENRSDKIGMFDTRTQTFQEWAAPTPGAWPYDATVDRLGEVWSGGEYNDRILRLNPRTSAFTEYLMPGHTNVRRVWVDNATTPVTFWVGSNHAASIVKLEPLESGAQGTAAATAAMPDWAYAVPPPPPAGAGQPAAPAPPDPTPRQIPGSTLTFARPQISDGFGPADWFPGDHPRMPDMVAHGRRPDARACGLCHYPNGKGRQENAGVSGLPVSYFIQTLNDFRAGLRVSAESRKANTGAMIAIAKAMTPDEIKETAEYFAAMPWTPWIRVVETNTVPKMVSRGGIWIPVEPQSKEPIGVRVVETPEDPERTEILRDPRSGFIAYAPVGSLKKGEALVKTGGNRTLACAACHGADLKGLGPVPGIAGRSPSYLARQMYDMQVGARRGEWTQLMKPVVAKLTSDDLVSISAYVASLMPAPPPAGATQASRR